MSLSPDYLERVYAGVLGKLIGVYLGRPFEGWTHARISALLGTVEGYVHTRHDLPLHNHTLVVPDDDLSGSFTFLRALEDHGLDPTPAQIGQTWLNYLIEGRSVLWWGGRGNSTEHTAFLNLCAGIPAPRSGSIAQNGALVAEQIGAQIFIDGWAMVCPGDPERAADFARRAASVSHDGDAIHAAQLLAAMEALAFVEPRVDALLDTGLRLIPPDCLIARLASDLRAWAAAEADWRVTRKRVEQLYGYGRYGGNCHIVPNHALILLGLLYGDDSFQRSLSIVCTAGWDTDCNAGNLGCLQGVRLGLAGLAGGPDWRGPVADQLYLPTADGGRAISDAVRETYAVANLGRARAGLPPLAPKNGARFHFELPGAVQGFRAELNQAAPERLPFVAEAQPSLALANVLGHSAQGTRSLALRFTGAGLDSPVWASTPTFIPPGAPLADGYQLLASPTLSSGQTIRVALSADPLNSEPVRCGLLLQTYGPDDALVRLDGPATTLQPGERTTLSWIAPRTDGSPIAAIGLAVAAKLGVQGALYLDSLAWDGAPDLLLGRPAGGGAFWRRAWVNGVDQWDAAWPEAFRIVQNRGVGLLIHGTREWTDYGVEAAITPFLAASAGIAARVQGMRRCYALLLAPGRVRLVKYRDEPVVLDETAFAWAFGETHTLRLAVAGATVSAWVNGLRTFSVNDTRQTLANGGVALLVEAGCMATDVVRVEPLRAGDSDAGR